MGLVDFDQTHIGSRGKLAVGGPRRVDGHGQKPDQENDQVRLRPLQAFPQCGHLALICILLFPQFGHGTSSPFGLDSR